MIPQRRVVEDFGKAFEELDEEYKVVLDELEKELEEYLLEQQDPNAEIKENKMKKRVADICLKLIDQTPKDKVAIMETSYIITGYFMKYNLSGKLENAIDIAGELELPEEHVSGSIFDKWGQMRKMLEKYLDR